MAKTVSLSFPQMVVRRFNDLTQANQVFRDFARIVEKLRKFQSDAINDHATIITPIVDAGAPGITPSNIGMHYINSSNGDVYYSIGTSSSADWKKLT